MYQKYQQKTTQMKPVMGHGGDQEMNEEILQIEMDLLQIQFDSLATDSKALLDKLKNSFELADKLTLKVLNGYLKAWKWNRKFHGFNNVAYGATIDTIQSWREKLFHCLWNTLQLVQMMRQFKLDCSDPFDELQTALTATLYKLVNGSFVVDQPPPQVKRMSGKFYASVRLLVGSALRTFNIEPIVKVSLIDENDAQLVVTRNFFCGWLNILQYFKRLQ